MINWPVNQPTLTIDTGAGDAITLRPLREEDIEAIFQACQDPTISAFTRVPYPYDRELAEEFVRGSDLSYRGHQGIVFAIDRNGAFAGTIGLHSLQLSDHCAEVGYWIEKSHREKGIATLALKAILNFSFNVAAFRRIEAMADYDNLASQRVMERAGMVRDALLRNRVTKPNGEQIDMVLYSMVKE
jgi:ribosomal-protein-alanine N-acetyltransferase